MAAANKEVHVIVCYSIAEGKDAAFIEATRPLVIATNKEKGCTLIIFIYYIMCMNLV